MPRISRTNNISLYSADTSAGVIGTHPTFTDNNDGTYDLGAFDVLIYDNSIQNGSLVKYNISTTSGYSMSARDISDTPDEVRYIVVDNQSTPGTPLLRDLTYAQLSLINESDVIPVYTMYNEGNNFIHAVDWDTLGQGLANMLHKRLVKTERFTRESGVALSITDPAKSVQISAGVYWLGAVQRTLDAFSSATVSDRWYWWHNSGTGLTINITTVDGSGTVTAAAIATAGTGYHVGDVYPVLGGAGTGFQVTISTITAATGAVTAITIDSGGLDYLDTDDGLSVYQGWTREVTSDGSGIYNSTHYDGGDGVGILPLTNNYYTVNWVYRDLEQDGHAGYVLGGNYQTYNNAVASSPRTDLPPEFSVMGVLVGRIIIEEGQTVAGSIDSLVESAFETIYAGQVVTAHDSLTGLSGGAAGEYNHLTDTEYGYITTPTPAGIGADYLHGIGPVATTLAFDNGTHVFSITGTNWTYYYKGKEVTIATSATIDLDTAGVGFPAVGLYFVYFDDATGVLTCTTTPWDLDEHVPVSLVYWNSATGTGTGAITDERHGYRRDLQWHSWAHSSLNTRYISGLGLTLPSAVTPNQIDIAAGVIADEDIRHAIANTTNSRIWRETAAGVWTFTDDTLPYYDTTTGTGGSPEWPHSGSSYTPTALTPGSFMPVFCYGSGDESRPIYIVVPSMSASDLYGSVAEARQHPFPTPSFAAELKLLYRFIYDDAGDLYFDTLADDYRLAVGKTGGESSAVTAVDVSFAPYSTIAATNVQAAIEELIDETSGGATITDNTTTNASYYPTMNFATSGTFTSAVISTTKLYFNPSTGTLNSTVFNTLSDATYKENIALINDATTTVRQLDGVSFNWKDNGNKSYGIIAQELEMVVPELVSTSIVEDKEIKSVNYDGLVAFLINTIKEMDARITELENK